MATYKHISGKRIHFIHIPRTGGRFIDKNLLVNDFKQEHSTQGTIEGSDVIHLHRELYEKHLDVKGIPHIAIIRNPIDRFISSSIFLKRMYGDIQEAMEDPIMFSTMIQNFPIPASKNWFCPQMDFISSGTNLWKFEDGFGKDFEEWFEKIIGVPIQINPKAKTNKMLIDETQRLEKTPKLIENVRMLYEKDIEFLYPELK